MNPLADKGVKPCNSYGAKDHGGCAYCNVGSFTPAVAATLNSPRCWTRSRTPI